MLLFITCTNMLLNRNGGDTCIHYKRLHVYSVAGSVKLNNFWINTQVTQMCRNRVCVCVYVILLSTSLALHTISQCADYIKWHSYFFILLRIYLPTKDRPKIACGRKLLPTIHSSYTILKCQLFPSQIFFSLHKFSPNKKSKWKCDHKAE